MKPEIFKAYDIRGVYPDQVNEDTAKRLGEVFAEEYCKKEVIIGHDARLSSGSLTKNLIRALKRKGLSPTYIGLVSSDHFYVQCMSGKLPGVMVTASHNPPEYNGFKMISAEGLIIGKDSGMEKLKEKMQNIPTAHNVENNIRTIRRKTLNDFIGHLTRCVPTDSIGSFSVVIDAGNGAVGPCLEKLIPLYKNLNVIPLFWEPDGRFPNRGPDPLKRENRKTLESKVLKNKSYFGVSFDGDGDRVFVTDEDGLFVPSDFLGSILAQYFLNINSEETVVSDVTVSRALNSVVSKHKNARSIKERVGHSFIKRTMRNEGSVLGVEKSGHFYFRDLYYADSGVLAMLYLLRYLTERNTTLKEAVEPLRKKFFLTEQINISVDKDPVDILSSLKKYYGKEEIDCLDGVSITSPKWRAVVRSSNTEPVIRIVAEASSQELLNERSTELVSIVKQS